MHGQRGRPAEAPLRLRAAQRARGLDDGAAEVLLQLAQRCPQVERRRELPGLPHQHRKGRLRERHRRRASGDRGGRPPQALPDEGAAQARGPRPRLEARRAGRSSPNRSSRAAISRTARRCTRPLAAWSATASTARAARPGPDLSQVAGRFSFKDLCESIVEPSKVISDQYRASVVTTDSGKVYTGRIVSETEGVLTSCSTPKTRRRWSR